MLPKSQGSGLVSHYLCYSSCRRYNKILTAVKTRLPAVPYACYLVVWREPLVSVAVRACWLGLSNQLLKLAYETQDEEMQRKRSPILMNKVFHRVSEKQLKKRKQTNNNSKKPLNKHQTKNLQALPSQKIRILQRCAQNIIWELLLQNPLFSASTSSRSLCVCIPPLSSCFLSKSKYEGHLWA